MISSVTIKSNSGTNQLTFTDFIGEFEPSQSNYFTVAVIIDTVKASRKVYLDQPEKIVNFFDFIARHWQGWSGESKYESIEGELAFIAEHNGKSAVNLQINLRSFYPENDWFLSATIQIELGQLETISKQVSDFFKRQKFAA